MEKSINTLCFITIAALIADQPWDLQWSQYKWLLIFWSVVQELMEFLAIGRVLHAAELATPFLVVSQMFLKFFPAIQPLQTLLTLQWLHIFNRSTAVLTLLVVAEQTLFDNFSTFTALNGLNFVSMFLSDVLQVHFVVLKNFRTVLAPDKEYATVR